MTISRRTWILLEYPRSWGNHSAPSSGESEDACPIWVSDPDHERVCFYCGLAESAHSDRAIHGVTQPSLR